MERGLVVEESAIKMLEAQLATGGIIDVRAQHRIPIDWALKRKLINEKIYRVLKLKNDDKGLLVPKIEIKIQSICM